MEKKKISERLKKRIYNMKYEMKRQSYERLGQEQTGDKEVSGKRE